GNGTVELLVELLEQPRPFPALHPAPRRRDRVRIAALLRVYRLLPDRPELRVHRLAERLQPEGDPGRPLLLDASAGLLGEEVASRAEAFGVEERREGAVQLLQLFEHRLLRFRRLRLRLLRGPT